MTRQRVLANRPWEASVGYSRAIRAGNVIEVSGTGAVTEAGEVLGSDVYAQAAVCFRVIGSALGELGASFADVTRTRVFLKDISRWEEAARAHGEIFGDIKPASTFVEASAFLDSRMLVEIEATALVG